MLTPDGYRWTMDDVVQHHRKYALLRDECDDARRRAYEVEREYWEALMADKFPETCLYSGIDLRRLHRARIRFREGEEDCLIKWDFGYSFGFRTQRPKLSVFHRLAGRKEGFRKNASFYEADLLHSVISITRYEDDK